VAHSVRVSGSAIGEIRVRGGDKSPGCRQARGYLGIRGLIRRARRCRHLVDRAAQSGSQARLGVIRTHTRTIGEPAPGRPGKRQDWPAGEACGRPCPVTLDVKFPVWITYDLGVHSPECRKSSMHTLRETFPQVTGTGPGSRNPHPQRDPQAAHNASGVSTQTVHRPVHSMDGRLSRVAADCPRRSIEQGPEFPVGIARMAAQVLEGRADSRAGARAGSRITAGRCAQ